MEPARRGEEALLYPWEKQPDETGASHAALVSYRDCPKPRSLRRAAAFHYQDDAEKQPTAHQFRQFKEWSRNNGWVPRVEAYDGWIDERKWRAEGDEAEKMGVRHAAQAAMGIEAAMLPFRALMKKIQGMPLEETSLMDRSEVELLALGRLTARLVPGMQKAERLARGEPTEILEGKVEHEHAHLHLHTAEAREAAKAYRDAIFGGVPEGGGAGEPGDPGAIPHEGEPPALHPGEAHPEA